MPKLRKFTIAEKCEWLRRRQALEAQQRAEAEAHGVELPPVRLTLAELRRGKKQIPAHWVMFTVAEVAELFAVSEATIYSWFEDYCAVVRSKKSQKQWGKRHFLISGPDIENFLNRHRGE